MVFEDPLDGPGNELKGRAVHERYIRLICFVKVEQALDQRSVCKGTSCTKMLKTISKTATFCCKTLYY